MLWILFLLFILFFTFLKLFTRLVNRLNEYPPGPFSLPIIGNVLQIACSADFLIKAVKKYDDVFTVWLPHPIVIVPNVKDFAEFRRAHVTSIIQQPFNSYQEVIKFLDIPGRIISINDFNIETANKKMFKLITTNFDDLKCRNKVFYHSFILQSQLHRALFGDTKAEINLYPILSWYVANMFSDFYTGKSYLYNDPIISEIINSVGIITHRFEEQHSKIMQSSCVNLINNWLHKNENKEALIFYGKLVSLIDERRIEMRVTTQYKKTKNYMDLYLKAEECESLNSTQLLGCTLMEGYICGMQKMINLIHLGFVLLAKHSHIQQKCYAEIVNGRKNANSVYSFNNIDYINATLNEIRRVNNLQHITEHFKVVQNMTIRNHFVQKNSDLLLFSDGEWKYSDQAIDFNPARFLSKEGKYLVEANIADNNQSGANKINKLFEEYAFNVLFQHIVQSFTFGEVPGSVSQLHYISDLSTRAFTDCKLVISNRLCDNSFFRDSDILSDSVHKKKVNHLLNHILYYQTVDISNILRKALYSPIIANISDQAKSIMNILDTALVGPIFKDNSELIEKMINAGIPSEKDVRILRQQSVANLEALKFKKVASKVERYEKVAAEQRTLRLMKRDNEEAKMMARRLKKETDAINKEISKAAEAKFKKNEKKLIEEKCFMTMETNAEPEKTIDIKSDNKVEQKNIMIMEEAVELGKTVTAKSDKRAEQPIQPLKSILVVSETDLKKLTQSGSEINQKKIRFDEKNLEENQKDVANKGKYVANNQLAVLREKKAIKDEYARDYAERLKENGCNERFQRHLEKKSSAYKYGIPLQGSKESYPPQLPSGNNKTNEKKSVVESKQIAAARKQPIDEDIIEVIDSGVNNSKRKSKLSRFFNFFRFKKAF